jgi:hypothetical protein
VANSFSEWALGCGHELTITHPEGYELDEAFTKGAKIELTIKKAFEDADFVYVKNWSAFTDYGKIITTDHSWMLKEKHLKKAKNARSNALPSGKEKSGSYLMKCWMDQEVLYRNRHKTEFTLLKQSSAIFWLNKLSTLKPINHEYKYYQNRWKRHRLP